MYFLVPLSVIWWFDNYSRQFKNIFFQFKIPIIFQIFFFGRPFKILKNGFVSMTPPERERRRSLIALIALARSLRSYFQSNSRSHQNLGFKRPTFYCFCIEERIGDFLGFELKKILQYRFRSISWPKNDAKWRKIFTVDCGVDRSVRHDLSMSVPLTPFKARVFISLSKNSIPNVIFTFFSILLIYLHTSFFSTTLVSVSDV